MPSEAQVAALFPFGLLAFEEQGPPVVGGEVGDDTYQSIFQPYSSTALLSSAACLTSAMISRRNWLRSGDGVASGIGAAGS